MNIESEIFLFAKKIGIDAIGICSPEPFYELEKILLECNSDLEGFASQDIEKRIDPAKTFKNVKSLIAVGVYINYNYKFKNAQDKLTVKLASSFSGPDYHRIVTDKLKSLAEFISSKAKHEYKLYADTGPLLDREVAKRAGIGFIGKNSFIISNIFGSRLFLGYILTDMCLSFSEVNSKNMCGDCSLCIEACPTGALRGERHMDHKRCLSYVSQQTGSVSTYFAEKLGIVVYGCDICQNICPFNKGLEIRQTEYEFEMPGIEEILYMSNKEFKNRFKDTSFFWRGKKILQRNCVIALSNMECQKAKDLVARCAEDEREHIRDTAVKLKK